MASDIRSLSYDLVAAGSKLDNDLSSCTNWNDDVKGSYRRFTEGLANQLRDLDYQATVVYNKVSYANSISVDKYKSELDGFKAQLRGI